jgi:phosphomevalonate kinase
MAEASAPGKLVITGEYAVLEGASAIVAAIDLQACARVSRISGQDSVLIDPLAGQAFYFRPSKQGGLHWIGDSPGARGKIIEAVFRTLQRELAEFRVVPPIKVSLDTDDFYRVVDGQSVKLGAGSSAAILVALMGALTDELELAVDHDELSRLCQAAHRLFQDGRGSGIDVAAALHGGVVAISPQKEPLEPKIVSLAWPDPLRMLAVWSGEAASTPDFLNRFEACRRNDPMAFEAHMENLCECARRSVGAWLNQSAPEIMAAAERYSQGIREFDRDSLIGILTHTHEQLRLRAERCGAVYKTSGAGGGDFGLVLADSDEIADKLRQELENDGFLVLADPVTSKGLTPGSGVNDG